MSDEVTKSLQRALPVETRWRGPFEPDREARKWGVASRGVYYSAGPNEWDTTKISVQRLADGSGWVSSYGLPLDAPGGGKLENMYHGATPHSPADNPITAAKRAMRRASRKDGHIQPGGWPDDGQGDLF